MSNNLGREAEDAVCAELLGQGYEIYARNKKIAGVEIDILARKESTNYIFEVKKRSSLDYALDSLGMRQLKRLERAASIIRGVTLIYLACYVKGEILFFEVIN